MLGLKVKGKNKSFKISLAYIKEQINSWDNEDVCANFDDDDKWDLSDGEDGNQDCEVGGNKCTVSEEEVLSEANSTLRLAKTNRIGIGWFYNSITRSH